MHTAFEKFTPETLFIKYTPGSGQYNPHTLVFSPLSTYITSADLNFLTAVSSALCYRCLEA
jgi:hypothetical protein